MKLQQKLAQPGGLGHAIGHGTVLSLRTGTGDRVMPLGGSGDQVVSEEDRIAGGGAPGVGAASPISVGLHCQVRTLRRLKQKTHMQRATYIAQNALEGSKMRLPRIMHEETDLLNGICEIRTGEGQPLKSSCEAAIIRRILDGRPIC
jgi:hypothetical protein